MTKSEILEVVKLMQKDWQDCINDSDLSFWNSCLNGFCFWIYSKGYAKELFFLLDELEKDFSGNIRLKISWYKTYKEIGKQALPIRLEHLNRTIARLENELKTEL